MRDRRLRLAPLAGAMRDLYPVVGSLVVHDVSRDGRVLIHHGFDRVGTRGCAPGEAAERELGTYAASQPIDLTADGSHVLLADYGEPGIVSLLRPTRGGPEMRLGDGRPVGLSGDGRWALMPTTENGVAGLALTPIGPGIPVPMRLGTLTPGLLGPYFGAFHVDAEQVGIVAAEPGRPPRSFWVEPPDGVPRPVTPEGVVAVPGLLPGERVLGRASDGSLSLYPMHGGSPVPLAWRLPPVPLLIQRHILSVSGDGRFIYVREGSVPARVDRIEISTGRRTPFRVFGAEPRAGVAYVYGPILKPDGKGYAYGYGEWLQDLYLVEGLRF